MTNAFYTAHNYSTYYFANIVSNIIEYPMPYLRNLEGFCGDVNTQYFHKPFPRWSALHKFIEHVVTELFVEPDENLNIERAFIRHEIAFQSYDQWEAEQQRLFPSVKYSREDWMYELPLTAEYEVLISSITEEVFSVLFANRTVLQNLNEMISNSLSLIDGCDIEIVNFVDSKMRSRRKAIPEWAAKAVFYRDRGKCTNCKADLTGLISPQFSLHVDHIIPLAQFGINDVTNLQLLCPRCNTRKGKKKQPVSKEYERWYPPSKIIK